MMKELWSLSSHLVEEEVAGEDVVVVEEEVMVLNLTTKLSKMEGTMDTMLLNSIVSMMMEVGIMSVEEEGAGEEEDDVVAVEEEVTTVLLLTMKINKVEETMVTLLLLQGIMGMMMEV